MKNIHKRISEISAQRLELEQSRFELNQVNLIELVRQNYDDWVKLFLVLKARNVKCYSYLVDLLASPEIGILTTEDGLRAAFSKVRAQRGERVFKKNGEAFSNKQWDGKSVTRERGHADRGRYSRSQPVASPGVPTARIERPAVGRSTPGVGLPLTVEGSQAVPAPGEKFTVSWSLEGPDPVFQGIALPASAKLVDKLRALEKSVGDVALWGTEEDCVFARTFLVGYLAKLGYSSFGTDKIEGNMWPQLAQYALDRLQSRIN